MKFSQIGSRLTGISTPIFGASWTPPVADVEVASRVLIFLEDRRVLYAPDEVEIPEHCVASVLEIRRFLTDQLGAGGIADDLSGPLRAMRAACRKFLGDMDEGQARAQRWHLADVTHSAGWVFQQGLGELRGVIGVHVAQLAARYGLDVPDTLAVILPAADSD